MPDTETIELMLKRHIENGDQFLDLPTAPAKEWLRVISTNRMLHNPDTWQHRWIGKCGHEWRKDQSYDCPICECAELRKRVETVL